MKLIIDTREKDLKRIAKVEKCCQLREVEFEHRVLSFGDYMIEDNNKIVVDTKKSICEIATNLFGVNDSKRFMREIAKVKNNGSFIVFLIEEQSSLLDLQKWKSPTSFDGKPYTKIKGFSIANKMRFYEKYYPVKFVFCHKNATGNKILDILIKGEF